MRKATKEEIAEFIRIPMTITDGEGNKTEHWHTEEEARFILENYILKYQRQ